MAADVSAWRESFLEAGAASLQSRPDGDRDRDLKAMREKIGEMRWPMNCLRPGSTGWRPVPLFGLGIEAMSQTFSISVKRRYGPDQHGAFGLGGQRLPLSRERGLAGGAGHGQSYPPKEAPRPPDAEANPPRQCREVGRALEGRTRLRPPEGPQGNDHSHHRAGTRAGDDHAHQPRLQHHPMAVARQPTCSRPTGIGGRSGIIRRRHRPEAARKGPIIRGAKLRAHYEAVSVVSRMIT